MYINKIKHVIKETTYLIILISCFLLTSSCHHTDFLESTCNTSSTVNEKNQNLTMLDPNEGFHTRQIFENLEGEWRLQRTVGDFATMEGEASFQKVQANNYLYYYKEIGNLKLKDGSSLPAYREYAYSYKNDDISVNFWDSVHKKQGSLLHKLSFSKEFKQSKQAQAYGIHNCGLDTYKAHYTFYNCDRFKLVYHVNGPHKNYIIQTNFFRIMRNII